MGYLVYGNTTAPIEVDDALLAHLRVITVTKLRRNESFALTVSAGGGLETLWIHASIPLRFIMEEELDVHRPLLVSMMDAANSTGGLDLTREDFALSLASATSLHAMSA